jgi:hypothetical protein
MSLQPGTAKTLDGIINAALRGELNETPRPAASRSEAGGRDDGHTRNEQTHNRTNGLDTCAERSFA